MLSRAYYDPSLARSGDQSLRLGLVHEPDARIFSSARQTIHLPDDGRSLALAYWYYPLSDDPSGNDGQIVRLLDENNVILEQVMRVSSDERRWLNMIYPLDEYAGQAVILYLGVFNDGLGGTTAMYVDDVRVQACWSQPLPPTHTPTLTNTPTSTPSPTPTPPPTWTKTPGPTDTPTLGPTPTPACANLARNPSFTETGHWETDLNDAYPARYSDAIARSGGRSLLLGIHNEPNAASFSSAWQLVDVPAQAAEVRFSFWYYPVSTDTEHDRQYVLVLDERDAFLGQVLWGGLSGERWIFSGEHDLTHLAGRRLKLYFGVRNDGHGGSAAMYVDDVALDVCMPPGVGLPTPQRTAIRLPLILRPGPEDNAEAKPAQKPEISPLHGITRAALDAAKQRLYVATGSRLAWFDAKDKALLGHLDVGGEVHGLALDSERGRVYASIRGPGGLVMIDAANGTLLARHGGPQQPGGVAVSGDRVYVADTGSDQVWVWDLDRGAWAEAIPVGPAPYALTSKPVTGAILVAEAGGRTVRSIGPFDSPGQLVVSLGGLGHPQHVAVDHQSGDAYVLYSISPHHAAIAHLDAQTLQVKRTWRGEQSRILAGVMDLAVDAERGLLLLAGADRLLAVDLASFERMGVVETEGPLSALATDVATSEVYAVQTGPWDIQIWGPGDW